MGCGQSKINLYPRRNKNGGKGHSAKKSGAADKEADEEEGAGGGGTIPEGPDEDVQQTKHILPLSHPPVMEVSASQLDFFKMLDEKIEMGRDYDSSSETEVRLEQERRRILIDRWRSASQTTQSFQSDSSPPTPGRRRPPRPLPQTPERQSSPGTARRYCRQQHVPDGMSPPTRRAHSAQAHHQSDHRQINGDNWNEANKSPVRRPQSAGASWKCNSKVTSYNQKSQKIEGNEHQRTIQKDTDMSGSSQDISQTYNSTFQNQSPAHSAKNQPYIAQISQYPTSQQVTPPTTPKFIAPPEEYQDPQNNVVDNNKFNMQRTPQTPQANSQSNIYYIQGNAAQAQVAQDLMQQRQQTAIHLQQYVAMKQAQQQMFTYLQRGPHTLFPGVDYVANSNRMYEPEELQQTQYHPAMRPYSAPTPVGVVRPMAVAPNFAGVPEGAQMMQMPVWTHMPPVVSTMGPTWGPADMQYYPQSHYMNIHRPNSAGSAGTLTRYQKRDTSDSEVKNNMCQSINLVRQKPIGQIVSLPGQELTVCNNLSDSSSPASVSTDSGVSPGHSEPRTKFSVPPVAPAVAPTGHVPAGHAPHTLNDYNNSLLDKVKNNKTAPITRSLKNSKSLDA